MMHFNRRLGHAFSATAALVVLSACSANDASAPFATAAHAQSFVDAAGGAINPDACGKSKIYVADYLESAVEIYSQVGSNPAACGKITMGVSSPEGVYVDAKSTLYVANYIGSTVTEYPRG